MSLTVNVAGVAKASIATPMDRKTDEAMAAQDQAGEVISQGNERRPATALDRLVAAPDGLARFR